MVVKYNGYKKQNTKTQINIELLVTEKVNQGSLYRMTSYYFVSLHKSAEGIGGLCYQQQKLQSLCQRDDSLQLNKKMHFVKRFGFT